MGVAFSFQARHKGLSGLEEAALPAYFGEWLKSRRRELDLTQAELSDRVGCSLPALRKIEGGVRRPSKQLAGLLAGSLEIPPENQNTFIRVARGELNVERLGSVARQNTLDVSLALPPNSPAINLPVMLTPFIGREPELLSISQLLVEPQCRLLTLVGPGGIGKTRLAIEVANHHRELFPDGIWFVPLAPISSPAFLVSTIADALNLRFQELARPRDQLLNFLCEKQAILVMDNVEHLLDGVGLFSEILERSPQVKLLVTSRERLNLLSEWLFEIQGLPVPPNGQVEQFEKYSSVALFLQSARRVRADFDLQDDQRRWVVRICQLVEGMPLGIELAAAWVGLLSCEEIAREIERNLDFLAVSMRDLPERHRSLRATLDHSWNLLIPEEKAILRRLSVFRGSFRRRAAQEICGANLTLLSSLKDKSLLRRTDQERYELHEIIRQYAALRLAEDADEDERIKDQHAEYFAGRLSEWEKALKSSKQTDTFSEMADEIDNLRQAWQRMAACCEEKGGRNALFRPNLFNTSLFSLSLFYEMRCRNWEAISLFTDSVESLKTALDGLDKAGEYRDYQTALGHVTAYLGLHHYYTLQLKQALELLEDALRLLDHPDAAVFKAQAQIMLAAIYEVQGELMKAEGLSKKSLAVFRKENDRWWHALAITALAYATLSRGDIQGGILLYQEGLQQIDAGDLRLGVPIRNGLGYAKYLQGLYSEAEQILVENLDLSFKLGNQRQTAGIYRMLGQIALASSHPELAEKHFHNCIDLLMDFGESPEMAQGYIYLGKCLVAKQDMSSARQKFTNVLQIGRSLNIFYLVYWGVVNLARVYWVEGQAEKALEMAIALQNYSVEPKVVQDDNLRLLEELHAGQSPQQVEASLDPSDGNAIETLLALI